MDRIDYDGCKCVIEKRDSDFVIRMFHGTEDCDVVLVSYVEAKELKKVVNLLENE